MKVVLLAGGFGTRISEESQFKPKPMVDIGGQPILWHIMKEYVKFLKQQFQHLIHHIVSGNYIFITMHLNCAGSMK